MENEKHFFGDIFVYILHTHICMNVERYVILRGTRHRDSCALEVYIIIVERIIYRAFFRRCPSSRVPSSETAFRRVRAARLLKRHQSQSRKYKRIDPLLYRPTSPACRPRERYREIHIDDPPSLRPRYRPTSVPRYFHEILFTITRKRRPCVAPRVFRGLSPTYPLIMRSPRSPSRVCV